MLFRSSVDLKRTPLKLRRGDLRWGKIVASEGSEEGSFAIYALSPSRLSGRMRLASPESVDSVTLLLEKLTVFIGRAQSSVGRHAVDL